jgi:hypothetical protein
MASLIPGYEYDIFISYRQKDNKNDGWVTEFVGNLRKEVEKSKMCFTDIPTAPAWMVSEQMLANSSTYTLPIPAT